MTHFTQAFFASVRPLFLVLLFVPVLIFGQEDKGLLKTYLLLGESNMVGYADAGKIRNDIRADYANAWKSLITFRGGSQVGTYGPSAETGGEYKITEGTVGPTYSFSIKVAEQFPEEEVLMLISAQEDASLQGAWNPSWTEENSALMGETENPKTQKMFSRLKRLLRSADRMAQGKGYSGLEILGVVWVQGASDAKVKTAAEAYEQNLTTLITRLRESLKSPDLRFVFSQENQMNLPHIDLIRKAQENVAQNVKNTKLIRTSEVKSPKDYPKYDDRHFNTEGILRLGTAAGKLMFE